MTSFKIALTIDDLPVHGDKTAQYSRLDIAQHFTDAFKKFNLPAVTGFANMHMTCICPDWKEVITHWVSMGNMLGNHTFSHFDLEYVSESEFISDVELNQRQLSVFYPEKAKYYFRYPFLSESKSFIKRTILRKYFTSENYIIAPVTVDFHDFMWNTALTKCLTHQKSNGIEYLKDTFILSAIKAIEQSVLIARKLFSYDIHQIMLLHASLATSLFIEPLIERLLEKGAQFISLEEALMDKVYEKDFYTPERNGLNFLQQAASAYQVPVTVYSDAFRKHVLRYAYNLPSTISLP